MDPRHPQGFVYRRPSTSRSRAIRSALAALGSLAVDRVLRGLDARSGTVARGADQLCATLWRERLDRIHEVATEAARPVGCAPTLQRRIAWCRALLCCILLARLGSRYPEGPAPLGIVEPHLRSGLHPDERLNLDGAALVPMAPRTDAPCRLAFDHGDRRLVALDPPVDSGQRTILTRRAWIERGEPLDRAHVRLWAAGAAVTPGTDGRLLRRTAVSLRTAAAGLVVRLADPFARSRAPVLVGPLFVESPDSGASSALVRDAAGHEASLSIGHWAREATRCQIHALAVPSTFEGRLCLDPLAVWVDGVQRFADPVSRLRFERQDTPRRDPLLDATLGVLLAQAAVGLDGDCARPGRLGEMVPHLRRAGWARLGSHVQQALGRPGPEAAVGLLLAIHAAVAALRAPVGVLIP